MLEINNLNVKVMDKQIINNLNLKINDGEIHAIMGPNGIGKSTICKTILNDPNYEVTSGNIYYKNIDITNMSTTDRARLGIFLLNQNPIAIEGVTNAELLRSVLSEISDKPLNLFEFNKELVSICNSLNIPTSFIHRNINDGMSGGERKKNELMHMWMLKPSLIMLDEIDSGLDVDALKLVAKSINDYYKKYKPSILIITHHEDLLKLIRPNYVHEIKDGNIIRSGDINLALDIVKNGYNKANEGVINNNHE